MSGKQNGLPMRVKFRTYSGGQPFSKYSRSLPNDIVKEYSENEEYTYSLCF